ncbi:hypothetical protein P9112_010334 [Eukaryota sp. TZLM1-RC]
MSSAASSPRSSSPNYSYDSYSPSQSEFEQSSRSASPPPTTSPNTSSYQIHMNGIGSSHVAVLPQADSNRLQVKVSNVPPDQAIVFTIENKSVYISQEASSLPVAPQLSTQHVPSQPKEVEVGGWQHWQGSEESQSLAQQLSNIFGVS